MIFNITAFSEGTTDKDLKLRTFLLSFEKWMIWQL